MLQITENVASKASAINADANRQLKESVRVVIVRDEAEIAEERAQDGTQKQCWSTAPPARELQKLMDE